MSKNDDGGRDQCTFVLSLKKKKKKNRHPMPNGQNDPQSLCVVFVIFLLYTKVNRVKMCKASNAKGPKRSTIIVCRLCHFLVLH